MTPHSRASWLCRTCRHLAAALAVLTLIVAGKSAFATCGDYLVDSGMSETLAVPAQSAMESPQADGESAPERPCRGPHCRQSPPAPAAPGAPLKWSPHTDHAIVTTSNTGAGGSSARRPPGGHVHERPGHPGGIERPPRPA